MIERYSHPEISKLWELENKFEIWKEIEIFACEYRTSLGEISKEDFESIKTKAKFDVPGILKIESEVHHDVIAFLTNLNQYIGPAGRHVHFGLTSSDIVDTAFSVQIVQSADLILQRIDSLLEVTKEKAIQYKMLPCIGRSHGIHAEPMTLGLKFALFYEEMKRNRERLVMAKEDCRVGKLSGAVGTYSNTDPKLEAFVCEKMGLKVDAISTQVISRDRHAFFLCVLGVIASSLDRMAQEIRLLQKTEGREVEEPFAKGQKGSSAMPHKRNPVVCERICGIARVIQANANVGFRDVALWHERDISHSSAERIVFPDSLIALHYILERMEFVLKGLHVYPENIAKTMDVTRGLFFSQKALLTLIDVGKISREEAYKIVQEHAMVVWNSAQETLKDRLLKDQQVSSVLTKDKIESIFLVEPYLEKVDFIFKRLGLQ